MVGKRRADMTPEELERERARHREYNKRWREANPELVREQHRRSKQRWDAVSSIGHYSKQNNREYDTHKNVSLDDVHPVTGQAWVENLDSETPHF